MAKWVNTKPTFQPLIVMKTQVGHTENPRTRRQKEKLYERIKKTKRKRGPTIIEDVRTAPDKDQYMKADPKEMKSYMQRKVFTVFPLSESNGHEIRRLMVLLIRIVERTYKSRGFFNGGNSILKILILQ